MQTLKDLTRELLTYGLIAERAAVWDEQYRCRYALAVTILGQDFVGYIHYADLVRIGEAVPHLAQAVRDSVTAALPAQFL